MYLSHKFHEGSMNFPESMKVLDVDCKGDIYFDEGLEGNVCTMCEYCDGVK